MRNNAPIFVNGFQRGGTNILVNLIASHPDAAAMRVETHEVFYGREQEHFRKWINRMFYLPMLISSGQHIFWPYRLYERKPLPDWAKTQIDFSFFVSKLLAPENRQLGYGLQSSWRTVAAARLVCKNVNAVTLLTQNLMDIYPNAIFFALVRNGLALCEGFTRRGWTVERIGRLYERIGQQMLTDQQRYPNYHLLHFEDMLADPVRMLKDINQKAGLDFSKIQRIRLQAKASMDKDGQRKYTFGQEQKTMKWFALDDVANQFRRDVNANQINRLSEEQKAEFLSYAGQSMRSFGYL